MEINVYLAKHPLASGLDVEYVKSNLLRIPGLSLFEFGMGVLPEECDKIVFVPERKNYRILSKANFNEVRCFDKVSIFMGEANSFIKEDVEPTTPVFVSGENFVETDFLGEEEDWNKFGCIKSTTDRHNLSYFSDSLSWLKIPRHHKPQEQYAMPEIPSFKNRLSAKAQRNSRPSEGVVAKYTTAPEWQQPVVRSTTSMDFLIKKPKIEFKTSR